jgi:hypothetical protein
LLETQAFRDDQAIQLVKHKLHQSGEQGCGNCALQNRVVIVKIQPADDRFPQTANTDERASVAVPTFIIALVFTPARIADSRTALPGNSSAPAASLTYSIHRLDPLGALSIILMKLALCLRISRVAAP